MFQDSGRGQGSGQGRLVGEGLGSGGTCVCIKCGFEMLHRRGMQCMKQKCPKCGSVLLRKGGTHYRKAIKNKE